MDKKEHALEIAGYRYSIIAEAVEVDGESITEAVKKAASKEWRTPTGEKTQYSERQIWRFVTAHKKHGFVGLQPKPRSDKGKVRAMSEAVLETAASLRRENIYRPTKTIIDILVRQKVVEKGILKISTLDHHLEALGLSRRILRTTGKKTFKKILTVAPLELVIADFHHGPYVRLLGEDYARRALLLVFIDHFSRYILEGRYYVHEDFAALRFGFRRVLMNHGHFDKLYVDNGPSFGSGRLHAACSNKEIDILLIHSKPYQSEGRGVCERFNRTVKEQFENEARQREDVITLDELNQYFEAWLAQRYHRDIHSETQEAPFERFSRNVLLRERPPLERLDELLRLRKSAKVHPKWSTVECQGIRYSVDPSLRGRKVYVLYDAMDKSYILIEQKGGILQRAEPQMAGGIPKEQPQEKRPHQKTDYLELLRKDHENYVKTELLALDLRPDAPQKELSYTDFIELIQSCRGAVLLEFEKEIVTAVFRKMRPMEPEFVRKTIHSLRSKLGIGLHVRIYTDAFQTAQIKHRAQNINQKQKKQEKDKS